ncbi:hypothetical protein BRC82_09700 [Halobacteriales archaeon QS_1_67_19]|nr:MAG: hypothetical protein BRC82_09700 [Halobacteriales archaeon QS_1_67_19]
MSTTTLADFVEQKPLSIEEQSPFRHQKEDEIIGFLGWSDEFGKCIVCERCRDKHYYRKENGYAFSETTLRTLDKMNVNRIVIEEVDTGHVLVYNRRDFHSGEKVHHPSYDRQRCVPDDEVAQERRREDVTINKASMD